MQGGVPSGWARERTEPGVVSDFGHRFYDSLRRRNDTGKSTAVEWGKGDKVAKG
jgi:hydrogenase small subunit